MSYLPTVAPIWIEAITAVLLFFVSGALAVIAYRQLTTTRAQLRAYVFVDETQIFGLDRTKRIGARSKVTNFGSTPATKLRSRFELFVTNAPPSIEDMTETKVVTSDLGPGQFLAQITSRHALSEAELDALRKRENAVYLLGIITYEDAFRREQTTEFLFIKKARKKDGLLEGGVMALCETGNKAT